MYILNKKVKKAIIKASDLHRSAGKALRRVAIDDEHLVVERDGYPIAVILSYRDYEELLKELTLASHQSLVNVLGREAERKDITEGKMMDELEETRSEIFKERYAK